MWSCCESEDAPRAVQRTTSVRHRRSDACEQDPRLTTRSNALFNLRHGDRPRALGRPGRATSRFNAVPAGLEKPRTVECQLISSWVSAFLCRSALPTLHGGTVILLAYTGPHARVQQHAAILVSKILHKRSAVYLVCHENNSENGFPTPTSATATFAANSTRKERHRCTLIRCSAIEFEPTVVKDMPQGWHSPTAYFCPTLAMDAAGALRQ